MTEMTISDAQKILDQIQKTPDGNRCPCKLKGDTVMVTPLAGNAFRIESIRLGDPARLPSYRRLNDAAADIHIEREGDYQLYYTATVTWDTMLHYLVRTGDLTVIK